MYLSVITTTCRVVNWSPGIPTGCETIHMMWSQNICLVIEYWVNVSSWNDWGRCKQVKIVKKGLVRHFLLVYLSLKHFKKKHSITRQIFCDMWYKLSFHQFKSWQPIYHSSDLHTCSIWSNNFSGLLSLSNSRCSTVSPSL